MGLSTLPQFAEGLISAGLPGSTPAVAVQDGTTSTQRVVDAELANLAAAVESAGLKSPTLIIIGRVIALLRRGEAAQASAAADAPDQARTSAQLIEELTAAAVDGSRATGAAPAETLSSVEQLLRLMR
jgi:siroheme synthase